MKVSLNQLVGMLADRVGQPFSIPLQKELKVILNYKREDWIQKALDKHPEQRKFYLKDFSENLVKVDRAECPIAIDCSVLRTEHVIPAPVRTEYALFDYVGDPDKLDGYTYTTPEQLLWIQNYGSRYTQDRPKYFYVNSYVYIYNENDLESVNIRGLWPDQTQLKDFKCDGKPCYTDDDQYEMPGDLINIMIQDVLKNELRILMAGEPDEVTLQDTYGDGRRKVPQAN